VSGDYFVLGKAPSTEQFFKGMLHLKVLGDHYEFSGLLNGENEVGEAWTVLCYGEVPEIEIKYASRTESMFCSIGADADNNLRFTCGPVGAYDHEKSGLETWFGYNEPPH
jgi:hypothetical protein